jgi:hypothetical protein
MPERSLLSIVARTAHWLTWYRRFGPASGSDPKIKDKLGRYSLAVFTGGDGTQVDTYIDNLLAETSIRYGGFGGIAYHYISDTYVALFSRFIPCGVWEATCT